MEKVNKFQLGDRIRELRTAAGHTQDDLAALLDKHRQVVSYYENGTRTPNLSELMTIAKEYNTTTDYLLGLTDVATTNKDMQFICDFLGLDEQSICLLNLNAANYEENYSFNNAAIRFLSINQENVVNYLHYVDLAEQAIFSDDSPKISDDDFNYCVEQAILYQYKISKSFDKFINTNFFTILSEVENKKENDCMSDIKAFLQEKEILEKDIEPDTDFDDELPF